MTFTGFPLIGEEMNTTCSSFFHSSAFFSSPLTLQTTKDKCNAQQQSQLEHYRINILRNQPDFRLDLSFPCSKGMAGSSTSVTRNEP